MEATDRADDVVACPAWQEAIGACVAGWLTDHELGELRGHTRVCNRCGAELTQLTAVGNWLRAQASN